VSSGERPGPAVLYAPPPRAPQLENADPAFVADFDRVSGTERYVDGEYLYTDHLYDDRGADNALEYPTDRERYGDNAADLVEFRISTRPKDALAFRFTLNTLLAPDTTMAVAAFDVDASTATGSETLPYDPRSRFPGTDALLAVWGTGATWSTWSGDAWITTPVAASVDVTRNQLTAAVPKSLANASGEWETTVAVGLRDDATGGFLLPVEEASETHPGGGGDASAIFNLAFRFDEPVVRDSADPDTNQGAVLEANTPTSYQHEIDFSALAARSDRTTVPSTGSMVRFFPSRLKLGEGKDLDSFPAFLGQLQPYTLYVPSAYEPGTRLPLTLNLHSLGERHFQYTGSHGVQQMGELRNNLVATADARGEDGWYQNEAEYDVFEMWNDIAQHFSLDPDRAYITGYSMGGYATYRLGTLYPDLFARAASVVGPPGDGIWLGVGAPTGGAATLSNLWLENARNLPFMNIVAAEDELVPITGTSQQNVGPAYNGRTSFDALGYRFAFDVYPAAEHLTLAILGYNLPQLADYLGDHLVPRDPFRVTFAYTPAADDSGLGLVHDKAYWVSQVLLRDPAVGTAVSATAAPVAKGVIDVESLAHGIDDPASEPGTGSGTAPLPYAEVNRTWAEPPARPTANALEVRLTNISSATVDLSRARIDTSLPIALDVTTDGPATLTLSGPRGRTTTVTVLPGIRSYAVAPSQFR
jgi:poly(3-hydroxybutyrate) depolymerase